MRQWIRIMLIVLACWSCQPEEVEFVTTDCFWTNEYLDHPHQTAYQSVIDQLCDQGIPGINLLIDKDGEGVWIGSSGYARLETGQPILPCHAMPAGSVSKLFTGLAAMMMYEDGLLSLDASIEDYLGSELAQQIPNGTSAEVCHLLSHTSGIPDLVSNPAFLLDLLNNKDVNASRERVLSDFVYNRAPLFKPGEQFEYSNSNFEILTLIMDEVYPDGHADYFSFRILNRLGLKKTWYKNETDYYTLDSKGMANGYFDRFSNGMIENATEWSLAITSGLTGAAGIVTTVTDLHLLLKAIFNAQLISEDTLEKMKTYILKKEGLSKYQFGLGLSYKTFGAYGQAIGHTGKLPGYNSEAWFFPERNAYIIYQINFGNAMDGPLQRITDDDFRYDLLNAVLGQ